MGSLDTEIMIEVAYALAGNQLLLELRVTQGTTAREALAQSGILARIPEFDHERLKVGIFGKVVKADTVLQAGDRVEIYRPLIADPKEARRRRATRKG